MERIARVLVTCPDDDISKWAEEDDIQESEVIVDLKREFEEHINSSHRKLMAKMEFIEWENFCPRCESTNLKHEAGGYQCWDCEFSFTRKDMVE